MDTYDFSRLSVLIVDDSVHIRRLVRAILHAFGCRDIYDAPTGTRALKELRSNQIDVIILDWMMEPMDGIELTRRIRTGEGIPNPYVPIIMLTGHTTMNCILQARESGVTEYLAKPITPKGLMSRLRMVIAKPRPFVRTPVFFGPDRRRKDSSFYQGPERREDEINTKDTYELDDKTENAA